MTRKQSLQYIKNSAGGSTVDNFIEDWEPVGEMEWRMLQADALARVDSEGKIWLTAAGQAKLESLKSVTTD